MDFRKTHSPCGLFRRVALGDQTISILSDLRSSVRLQRSGPRQMFSLREVFVETEHNTHRQRFCNPFVLKQSKSKDIDWRARN
jgi:hypothetical protein